MKARFFTGFAVVGFWLLASPLPAADTVTAPVVSPPAAAPAKPAPGSDRNSVHAQLQVIVDRINAKIKDGAKTEADLAFDLRQFDYLLTMHRAEKTDEVADILYAKYSIYLNSLHLKDQALATLKQIARDFPNTTVAKAAAPLQARLEAQLTLAVGKPFHEFPAGLQDLAGAPLSLAKYRGKIVLVDFWATWCVPCVAEMPNVIAAYNKYHSKGLEIIGVTLDNADAGGHAKVAAFIKDHKMPWPQFYDGLGWNNVLAVQCGVEAIPTCYLLGRDGKILAISPRGPDLAPAIEKALAGR